MQCEMKALSEPKNEQPLERESCCIVHVSAEFASKLTHRHRGPAVPLRLITRSTE